jgi:transposase
MMIIGCDFHPSFQQIAYVDQETGEYVERCLRHREEAVGFYRSLTGRAVRIGVEATGNDRWFRKLMSELGHEFLVGDASAIHASAPREQRTDKRDARHILRLLMENRFPAIWQPSAGNEEQRQLLLHRCRLVRMRTRIKNQLDSIAKNEGLTGSRTWSAKRRQQIEALPLTGWYAERRADLLGLLNTLETRIKPLDEAVLAAAEQNGEAQLLMTHPGVGPVVSLAYVLILGDWRRFPRGKQVGSYLGLIPAEASSGKHQQRMGHVTKQGNTLLRWLLVEAATKAQSKDPSWHRQYLRLSMNKHHGVAKVAIAHKLAVRLYWMLRSGQNYTQIVERGSHAGQSVLAGGCGIRPTN